jgi:uncharacterized membrane protein YeaQ/YmgE (transglycosylase-associated protein family)
VFLGALAGLGGLFFPEPSRRRMALYIPTGIAGALVAGLVGWKLGVFPALTSWSGVVVATLGGALFVLAYRLATTHGRKSPRARRRAA